ncbi:zinc finger and SCAN domain-containing protein 2 [Synchiropus splendidus]|uniref:zinc finger and SCAN domain-containing protein 2 n=1 Tax=Synchiropus splendidus TaxID=270530 RepID=UPI00237D507A|nr:zinc finger and SCAN domain-containing protein 2 [Synchiropus splendidus]
MEGSSFQTQMLSIMEVFAQAAVAEINRRVDDCCAVLRLEVSQSRRDIDSLKRKCELMEAELRRRRLRVRRKGFSPPAVTLSLETQDQPCVHEPEPCGVQLPAGVQVKEEVEWQFENPPEKLDFGSSAPEDASHEVPFEPSSMVSPAELQSEQEPLVKRELVEAPDDAEVLAPLWLSEQNVEPDVSQQVPHRDERPLVTQTWTQQDQGGAASSRDQRQLSHSGHMSRNPSANLPAFGGYCRSRRTRTPWRSCPGERRYGCTYCDKSFLWFNHLKEHVRSHTGEKPYSCQQCGRRFTKQFNLMRHAVVHSGEKPFQCSLCGKCFTQRSGLKSHQKNAH